MNLAELIIAALLACPNLDISSRTAGDDYFSEYECRIRDGKRGIVVKTAIYVDFAPGGDDGYCVLSYTLTGNPGNETGNEFRGKDCHHMKELDSLFAKQKKAVAAESDLQAIEILQKALK